MENHLRHSISFLKSVLKWVLFPWNSKGLSLVELMVSLTILGLVSAAFVKTFQDYVRTGDGLKLADVVAEVKRSIEMDLRNPQNLAASLGAPGNGLFAKCFGKMAGAVCNQTAQAAYYPFVLASSPTVTLSGATNNLSGAAISNARRVLTATGQSCTPQQIASADRRCEIEVTTAFRAICPSPALGAPPAASCAAPQSVELFYVIRQLPNGLSFSRDLKFPVTSNMVDAQGQPKRREDAIRVVVTEFSRPTSFTCPAGQAFQGFDVAGNPLCGRVDNPCPNPGWIFIRMNPNGTPECRKPLQGESCPNSPAGAPLTLRGVRPDGSLDCVAPRVVNQGCPNGQVLVRFDAAGNPVCIRSHAGTGCPRNTFLVGYNAAGAPNCATMLTPASTPFELNGPLCSGHGQAAVNCNYGSASKPAAFQPPACPSGTVRVGIRHKPPRCCATCGWIGQWWCDNLASLCAPTTNAIWN